MCKLDIKNNRKKCVFKKRPIFPHSLLQYKVDIFLKIMCCLDRKYNRKMCVVENPQASSSNFLFSISL